MTTTATKFFGQLEYRAEDRLDFPNGLPGFAGLRHWLLLRPEGWEPLGFLQSLDRAEVCFVMLPVEAVDARYELRMTEEDLERLGLSDSDKFKLSAWVILTMAEGVAATANLLAPVVIAPDQQRAVQAVRDDARYSARHVIEATPGARACS